MIRRFLTVFVLACSLLGCAAIRGQIARAETLDHEISAYVIKQPLEEAWKIATSDDRDFWELIAGKGLTWEQTGKWRARSSATTETTKETDGSVVVTKTWYEAEGFTAGDGSRIQFFVLTEERRIKNGTEEYPAFPETSRNRALEMELAFIKKLDPEAGAAIEAKAQRAEQTAREE